MPRPRPQIAFLSRIRQALGGCFASKCAHGTNGKCRQGGADRARPMRALANRGSLLLGWSPRRWRPERCSLVRPRLGLRDVAARIATAVRAAGLGQLALADPLVASSRSSTRPWWAAPGRTRLSTRDCGCRCRVATPRAVGRRTTGSAASRRADPPSTRPCLHSTATLARLVRL
jgi:hypothetical protein